MVVKCLQVKEAFYVNLSEALHVEELGSIYLDHPSMPRAPCHLTMAVMASLSCRCLCYSSYLVRHPTRQLLKAHSDPLRHLDRAENQHQ